MIESRRAKNFWSLFAFGAILASFSVGWVLGPLSVDAYNNDGNVPCPRVYPGSGLLQPWYSPHLITPPTGVDATAFSSARYDWNATATPVLFYDLSGWPNGTWNQSAKFQRYTGNSGTTAWVCDGSFRMSSASAELN